MSKSTANTEQLLKIGARELEKEFGALVQVRYDVTRDAYMVEAHKGEFAIQALIDLLADENAALLTLRESVERLCATAKGENYGGSKSRIASLETELAKYKAAVKQLSFDLEMATSNKSYATNVETERVIRKFALEQAAEFLNDHGVIRTGLELEQVCEQIKKLHPTKDIKMGQAAAAMSAMFSTKKASEIPF